MSALPTEATRIPSPHHHPLGAHNPRRTRTFASDVQGDWIALLSVETRLTDESDDAYNHNRVFTDIKWGSKMQTKGFCGAFLRKIKDFRALQVWLEADSR